MLRCGPLARQCLAARSLPELCPVPCNPVVQADTPVVVVMLAVADMPVVVMLEAVRLCGPANIQPRLRRCVLKLPCCLLPSLAAAMQ